MSTLPSNNMGENPAIIVPACLGLVSDPAGNASNGQVRTLCVSDETRMDAQVTLITSLLEIPGCQTLHINVSETPPEQTSLETISGRVRLRTLARSFGEFCMLFLMCDESQKSDAEFGAFVKERMKFIDKTSQEGAYQATMARSFFWHGDLPDTTDNLIKIFSQEYNTYERDDERREDAQARVFIIEGVERLEDPVGFINAINEWVSSGQCSRDDYFVFATTLDTVTALNGRTVDPFERFSAGDKGNGWMH